MESLTLINTITTLAKFFLFKHIPKKRMSLSFLLKIASCSPPLVPVCCYSSNTDRVYSKDMHSNRFPMMYLKRIKDKQLTRLITKRLNLIIWIFSLFLYLLLLIFELVFSCDKQLKKWRRHSVCSSVLPSVPFFRCDSISRNTLYTGYLLT